MLIKSLRKSAELKSLTTNELALEISRLKNQASETKDTSFDNLRRAYDAALEEHGLCDFDDLLLKTRELLKTEKPDLPYNHILVDEFQDTNTLQYELLQLIRNNDNICVIGDPLQSIYGFRGADSTMFDRFAADFPDTKKVYLPVNYRSVPEVVQLTNEIFLDSPKLTAHTETTGKVAAIEVLNEYSEAARIIDTIEQSIGGSSFLKSHEMKYDQHEGEHTFRDFAILYRTHHAGKTVQRLLGESGIPFQAVGEGSFYERPAIWATIQIMRYFIDPSVTLTSVPALKNVSATQINVLLKTIDGTQNVTDLAVNIMDIFGLDQAERSQFIGGLVRFDDEGLAAYMRHVDELMTTDFYDAAADAVTLTTIHAAKGLEFNHVFLIAAGEGVLSHKNVDVDEERKLFYVAASRARTQLDILYARTRTGKPAELSRFVRDIDGAILPRTLDENIQAQKRRIAKRAAKRNQGTLFDF